MARREYAGAAAVTTLNGAINSSVTTLSVTDATGWPTGATGTFVIALDAGTASEEKVLCDSRSGTAIVVNASGRGYDGTTAAAHSSGATAKHVLDVASLTDLQRHVYDQTHDDHFMYANVKRASAATVVALQAACDAIQSAGGGTLWIDRSINIGTTTVELPYPARIMQAPGTTITYTGSGTAVQFKNHASAAQRLRMVIDGLNVTATTAAIGVDLKGITASQVRNVTVAGAASEGAVVASSIGILFDGSYGTTIGCWRNTISDPRVSGFATAIQFTGSAVAGRANQNEVIGGHLSDYTTYGIDCDSGDNNLFTHVDASTSYTGATGFRINDTDCMILHPRIEGTDIGIQVTTNAARTRIGAGYYVNNVTEVLIDSGATDTYVEDGARHGVGVKYDDSGTQSATVRTRMIGATLIPLTFTTVDIAASQTSVALVPVGADAANTLVYLGHAYQIRGVSVRMTQGVSAGTLTLKPTVGATESSTLSLVTTTGTINQAWQGIGKDTNSGSSGVGVKLTSSGTFAPTTADATVVVWVELVHAV